MQSYFILSDSSKAYFVMADSDSSLEYIFFNNKTLFPKGTHVTVKNEDGESKEFIRDD